MYNYGYDYGYGYGYDSYDSIANVAGSFILVGVVIWIIGMAAAVFTMICMWKIFTKAGKKGWASLIPVYNIIVMLEIAELPMWYLALFLVPFANIYAMFKIYIEIAHKFGKSTGFGVGMVFLNIVFIPMLAFDKAEYKGNSSNNSNELNNNNVNYNTLNAQQVEIPNIMNVNNGNNPQSTNAINMQNNVSQFNPIGNINNNISSSVGIPVSPMNNMANHVNVQPVQFNNTAENINQNSFNNINKTCPNCGNQIDYNAMFCTNCGQKL